MAEFKPRRRKKVCALCEGKKLNFLDAEEMSQYINEKGKILPRRATGTCARHQREVAREVKRARMMAVLPFTK
ncbi:MAG: 30S ribosomal protein S18 [Bacilli bacterium]|nr:30S ribosomal protein S18 [Bacilli bacterium]